MQVLQKNGVRLAYDDSVTGPQPIIFVHGCGFDHSSFANQANYFRSSHRVVSVDLRGHGMSDAPRQEYTIAAFADDLAWLCEQLGLFKPVLVGHSMGGNVALEFAARYPTVPASVVLIDSAVLPPQSLLDALEPVVAELQSDDFLAAYQQVLLSLRLAWEKTTEAMINALDVPQHVLASAFYHQVKTFDGVRAASRCHVPVAYIGAATSLSDLVRFKALTPQLVTAKTLGSGHFSPVEQPDQINSMLSHFIECFSTAACLRAVETHCHSLIAEHPSR